MHSSRTILFAFLILFMCVSCRSRERLAIEGGVFTAGGIIQSYASGKGSTEGLTAISGARIYLSQTKDPRVPIRGFEVKSTNDGSYRIELTGLPASTDDDEEYCLVVEKNGYEPLTQRIKVGAFARFLRNTITLKSTSP